MCGIVGGIQSSNIVPFLLKGLSQLEYRGYDSAGIAVVTQQKQLSIKKVLGKVSKLAQECNEKAIVGLCGIAHTRWATHGEPSEVNAHPHVSHDQVAVVHNGIIENYQSLRTKLTDEGYQFDSETDSEVIAHLVHYHLQDSKDLLQAVQVSLTELEGMYAIAVIGLNEPDCIIVARYNSPLVIGVGKKENYIASDATALLSVTNKFIYLENGDVAKINNEIVIYNQDRVVSRKPVLSNISEALLDKGGFPHYMKKEIFEQADCIANTLAGRLSNKKILPELFGVRAPAIFQKIENIVIVACGTSYYAGLVASYWLEEIAGVSCHVEIASEFRYRHPVIKNNTLFVAISQSGETADTLACFKLAKTKDYLSTLVICNVPQSSLVREAELVFFTRAGPEIGVASTKSFTSQLVALLLLTVAIGKYHELSDNDEQEVIEGLYQLPDKISQTLGLDHQIKTLAKRFVQKEHALFLGRGSLFPVALEGALKLKEITYIHAEGYPAGELKHGPLAIVDENMPVFVVAPDNDLFHKLFSNLQEVSARRGELIIFADHNLDLVKEQKMTVVLMPEISWILAPIIYAIPLQLLAYYVGVLRKKDVDQPRNLAKSVTVE